MHAPLTKLIEAPYGKGRPCPLSPCPRPLQWETEVVPLHSRNLDASWEGR